MKCKARFSLTPGFIPPILEEWLETGLPCDITVKRGSLMGLRVKVVEMEAASPESLEAMRKAFNTLLDAKGYGPGALREHLNK